MGRKPLGQFPLTKPQRDARRRARRAAELASLQASSIAQVEALEAILHVRSVRQARQIARNALAIVSSDNEAIMTATIGRDENGKQVIRITPTGKVGTATIEFDDGVMLPQQWNME